jgi:tRNA threonylcarbamoyladenosine biosynthesis protein TsaE
LRRLSEQLAAGGGGRQFRAMLAAALPLATEDDTAAFAARLAARVRPGDTLLLEGTLGAGKTALARALIRARLGDRGLDVPSPSYTLVQTYGEGADEIWHADLYRLGGPAELDELGLAEAFGRVLVLVEWPDRLGSLAPRDALRLTLGHAPDDGRRLALAGPEPWPTRLAGLVADDRS